MLRIWMANRFSKIGVLIFVWVLTVGSVPAQSGETVADPSLVTKEKLEAVQAEIESLRAQAARLSAQENSVLAVLGQYDVEAQIRIREIGLIDLKQKKTQEDIAILESQLRELQKNLEQQKAYLNRRLVEAYKQGEMNYLKLLLQVNSAADLARSYQYIAFLAKDDQRRIQQYRALFNEVEQTRLRLEQENRNLSLLRQDSEEAYRALLGSKQEKVRLLGAIQDQKEMHLSALSDLRLAAGQLQNFFTTVSPSYGATSAGSRAVLPPFKGPLDWPVRGKIIRDFGIYKHPKFGTTTMSNGIEIAAKEGLGVRAVFGGEVSFSEWFKGYGQCVILSHPEGFYTLYGHNSELLVQRGQAVQRGQLIAKVGSTGALNGPSLYFEIRKKDEPLNPREWLRR